MVEQHEAYFLLDQVFLYQKHISHQYQRWLYRFDAKGNILECFSIDGEEQLWSIRPPINQESIDGATFIFKDGILMLEK